MADEWTSFSDIGKAFGDTILSQDNYLKTEQAYIDCCIELIEKAQISKLYVKQAEYYTENVRFSSCISNTHEIRQVITACLREQCWLKLTSKVRKYKSKNIKLNFILSCNTKIKDFKFKKFEVFYFSIYYF